MSSPPAKRQRRLKHVLSDSDDSRDEPKTFPLRTSSKANAQIQRSKDIKSVNTSSRSQTKQTNPTKRKTPAGPSPKSSPEKSKKVVKKEPEKSKSLHTFFNRATEEQRWSRKADTPEEDIDDAEFGDDIVDDDSLDEALLQLAKSHDKAESGLVRRKGDSSVKSNGVPSTQRPLSSGTQRFVKPAITDRYIRNHHQESSLTLQVEDHRPWSEKYAPSNLDELAVHKKKVAEVQTWLGDVLNGRHRRKMLVLKGPAGSGKSITTYMLAKLLSLQVIPWSNPTVSEAGVTTSVAVQFDDFLNRGGRFGSLTFDDKTTTPGVIESSSQHKVLMVEEFPTTLTKFSVGLDSFRSVILQYLASGSSSQPAMFDSKQSSLESHPPLIMIITETLLTSTTAAADSFTAHRLLGPEISNHPAVTIMDFNPVAPTFVSKALDLVIKKEARESRRRRTPGPAVLQRLCEMGDIRSAVNSLEFLCVRGDDTGDWSGTVATKPKRSAKDGVPLTDMEKNSLELISHRETTLDMFHAAGKVVHNKREDPRMSDTRAEPPPKPPDHLMHLDKPKVSRVNIEALLNETGTDIQTFLSSLHENYILSCTGDSFVDSFDGCSDFLSDSDVLNPDSRYMSRTARNGAGGGRTTFQAGGSDMLRQDEISFHVATRGLLFALPFPVNRAAHPSGRKGDSFKMFYPAALRLWKPTEEIDALINMYRPNSFHSQDAFVKTPGASDGVASWQARRATSSNAATLATAESDSIPRAHASRDDLVLEILPYMSRIQSRGRQNTADTRPLTKITQFHGLHISDADEEPFEEEADESQFAVPRPPQPSQQQQPQPPQGQGSGMRIAAALSRFNQAQSQRTIARRQGSVTSNVQKGVGTADDVPIEKLYISDDDIQDD